MFTETQLIALESQVAVIFYFNSGWCGSTSSCVQGTQFGPLQPCVKSSYFFSTPRPMNPQTRVINQNVHSVQLSLK